MLMTTFNTVKDLLDRELLDAINHAESLKIISREEGNDLWFDKEQGMRWLNPKPEEKK